MGFSLRWVVADHGDHTLLLGVVQDWFDARSLAVIERTVQAATLVAVCDLADGLGGKGKRLRHLGSGGAIGELPKHQSAQDHPHLLDAAAEEFFDAGEIQRLDLDGYRVARHSP